MRLTIWVVNQPAASNTELDVERAVVTTQQTTTFTSDIPVTVSDLGDHCDIPYPLKAGPEENRFHDIRDFLSRPVVCAGCSVNWDGTSVANVDLITMNVPSGMLANTMISEKLSGFFGFRATVVMRMQVNSQRFQQGILLLNYVPIPALLGTDRLAQINKHIVFKTQLPSVRMNISSETEVVFRIPFVSPQNFYQRKEYSYDWAQFRATVYSPIVGGSAQITCWCHFEDVEPIFPVAQSGKIGRNNSKSNRYDSSDAEDSGGVLSSASAHFSRAFGDLSKVPLLTSIAAPTAWFLGATSKLLASFGFSNPVTTKPRMGITPKIMSHSNNCDTEDNSDSHGLFLSNKVARLPGFAGTDIDEMSLQYVSSIPSYLNNFNWTTANIAGATLYSQSLRPRDYFNTYNVTLNAVVYPVYAFAPLGYLAMMHQYWRGTIKFRFMVAKTEYHSGRLEICYNPDGTTGLTYGNSPYVYKWVWDLRQSNELEIEIPFVSGTPWRTNTLTDFTGYISVFVVNPLVAPASVSSSINFLVEVFGGEDFEVSGLASDLGFAPVIAYGPRDDNNKYLGHTHRVHAQSNMYKEDHLLLEAQAPGTQVVQRGNVGRISNTHDSINPLGSPDDKGTSCLYTIGEMITSFRQILKRSMLLGSTTFSTASRDRVMTLNPFAVYLPGFVTSASPPTLPIPGSQFVDWYSWIAPLYAMRRGGVLTKTYNSASNGDCSLISFISYGNSSNAFLGPDPSGTRNIVNYTNNTVISNSNVQGALETHIPFYAASHSVPVFVSSSMLTTSPPVDPFVFTNNPEQRIIATTSSAGNNLVINVTRQVADDFDLGLFIGVLPLRAYVGSTASYSI